MQPLYAWIRRLKVTLTSIKFKKQIVFGENHLRNEDDLYIEVNGYKYLSTLKDECVVKIKNLTLSEVVQIIDGQFYDIKVEAGYKSTGLNTIFDGGVLYISNEVDDRKSNTIIILCASKLIAKYGQNRLNLTMNSGINMYAAINFICKRAGIPKTNVSTQLKKQMLQNVTNVDNNVASFLDKLCSENASYIANSDANNNDVLTIFDSKNANYRVITLKADNMILQSYPRLTTEGVNIVVMPTFNFMCGDVIKIDNSLIQMPVQSKEELSKNYGYYLDDEGFYMIFQMQYHLQNKGHNFNLQLNCKARNLVSNFLGG